MKQSYRDFEIIILDEYSQDGTEQMVNEFAKGRSDIIFIQRKQKGLGYGRNQGVLLARGEIIAFIDDDEEAHPDWLRKGISAMKDHDADLVRGAVYYADGSLFRELRTDKMEFPTANIFYRKKVIESAGMFDEKFVYCSEDVDMGIRAMEQGGKLVLCKDAVTYHVCRSKNPFVKLKSFWYSERFRAMNRVLRYKKHKKYFEKQLVWKVFYKESHITAVIIILSGITSILNAITLNASSLYWIAGFLSIVSYILFQVVVDWYIPRYPLRIIFFPYYLILDVTETIYTISGAVKFKFFML